jgi:hypothetical protein
MKKQSKLGTNFPVCKMACGICATNDFRLPYRLGVALFDLEESDKSKHTLESIAKQFKTVTYHEILTLYAEVLKLIKFYEVKQKC